MGLRVSQFDAAADLGVSLFTVLQFVWIGRLVPAEDPQGRGGVTRSSLLEEAEWRRQSTSSQRFVRRFRDFLHLA